MDIWSLVQRLWSQNTLAKIRPTRKEWDVKVRITNLANNNYNNSKLALRSRLSKSGTSQRHSQICVTKYDSHRWLSDYTVYGESTRIPARQWIQQSEFAQTIPEMVRWWQKHQFRRICKIGNNAKSITSHQRSLAKVQITIFHIKPRRFTDSTHGKHQFKQFHTNRKDSTYKLQVKKSSNLWQSIWSSSYFDASITIWLSNHSHAHTRQLQVRTIKLAHTHEYQSQWFQTKWKIRTHFHTQICVCPKGNLPLPWIRHPKRNSTLPFNMAILLCSQERSGQMDYKSRSRWIHLTLDRHSDEHPWPKQHEHEPHRHCSSSSSSQMDRHNEERRQRPILLVWHFHQTHRDTICTKSSNERQTGFVIQMSTTHNRLVPVSVQPGKSTYHHSTHSSRMRWRNVQDPTFTCQSNDPNNR